MSMYILFNSTTRSLQNHCEYLLYLYSLSSAGGTGTITISFNLVDDSNPDSLFKNCKGGPNTGQGDDYWTHWLSKFESSVGGFKFRHLVSTYLHTLVAPISMSTR